MAAQSEIKIHTELANNNATQGIIIKTAVLENYKFGKNVVEAGFQLDLRNRTNFTFSAFTIDAGRNFQIKKSAFDLHIFYTVSRYSELMHEDNYGIFLSTRHTHFEMMIGTNFRTYSYNRLAVEFYEMQNDNTKIHENFNLLYSFGLLLNAAEKSWNLGVSVTDKDSFLNNQETNAFYKLHGYFKLNNALSFTAEVCYKPAGFLNTYTDSFGYFIRTGIIWKIK
jgi:hypothetical protein